MDEHTNKTPIHFPATNLKDPINGKYVLKLILKDTITAIMQGSLFVTHFLHSITPKWVFMFNQLKKCANTSKILHRV